MQINQTVLETVVQEAINKCGANKRWINAVRRAAEELATNPYIHHDGETLLVLSSSYPSMDLHCVDDRCTCTSYHYGNPCWHRAAKRLVELAMAS